MLNISIIKSIVDYIGSPIERRVQRWLRSYCIVCESLKHLGLLPSAVLSLEDQYSSYPTNAERKPGKCLMMITFQNKIIYMASNIVPVHILLSRNRILWEIARPASKCTSRDDRNLPKGMSGNTMARRKDQIHRWHFN